MALEAAWTMVMKGARLYDQHQPAARGERGQVPGRARRPRRRAAGRAHHGGFGYAKEYHVERLLREVTITRIAPVTEQLILVHRRRCWDLPKSH